MHCSGYLPTTSLTSLSLRTVIEELERRNYISTDAHPPALNIITAIESNTRVALTTASVSATATVQIAAPGTDAGHVKTKRAAALVPNITHLPDRDINVHDMHADRNIFDNRAITRD